MIYLTHINLNQNELQNAVLQPLATAPANPKLGQIYTDSTSSKIKWFDGSAWKTVGVVVEASETNGNIKVDGVEMTVYSLPMATSNTLGGVKIGAGFKISSDGTLIREIAYYTGIRQVVDEDTNTMETDNEVFTRVLTGITPSDGDVFVIKTLIATDKYSFSSFIYAKGQWSAMDGNVDATNVILTKDITTAGSYTSVGNIAKGSTELTAGKSIADVLQAIFTKELNPSTTQPYVNLSVPNAGTHEVGSVVAISYAASLNAGSYTYGPATGVVAESWEITDTAGNSSTEASGSFNEVTVTDDANYSITAKVNHTEGAIPVTNLGNEYASGKIAAGTKSKTSGSLTGFRKFFYGANVTAADLNSENIRKLTNSTGAVGNSQAFSISIPEGATQVIIAFPTSTNKTLSSVIDTGAMNSPITDSFIKSNVDVEGANGYEAVSYDVYVYSPDTALGANTYKVTIS